MIELHDSNFAVIDGFPLLWRWKDADFGAFSSQELHLLRPLKREVSRKLHNELLTVSQIDGLNRNSTNIR